MALSFRLAFVVTASTGFLAVSASAENLQSRRPPPNDNSTPVGDRLPDAERQKTERMELMRKAAAEYEIYLGSDRKDKLSLRADPVLRWSNPERVTPDGAVFLWTHRGRPEVVACFYVYQPRADDEMRLDHEFQSLAFGRVIAERRNEVVWFPARAGTEMQPVPNAAGPAETAALRLRQMRSLATEFKAFFDLPDNRSELRLLPQPLYRYENTGPDLVDGALFAFVQATDPEVLLLLEARMQGDRLQWHYGFARMSMVNLRAAHKEQEVWKVPWWDRTEGPRGPYITMAHKLEE